MSVLDRVVVGVDGTDFGFEALRQTLALISPGGAVYAVTALDTSIAVHAGYSMRHVSDQLEEEAEKARAAAAEILNDRPNCTAKVGRGDAKAVLRATCREYDATLLALGGRSSSRFLGILAGKTATTFLHEAAQSVLLARADGVSAGSRSGSWLASMVRSRPSPLFRWRTTSKLGSARRYRSWRLQAARPSIATANGQSASPSGTRAPVRRIARSLEICRPRHPRFARPARRSGPRQRQRTRRPPGPLLNARHSSASTLIHH